MVTKCPGFFWGEEVLFSLKMCPDFLSYDPDFEKKDYYFDVQSTLFKGRRSFCSIVFSNISLLNAIKTYSMFV